MQLAKSLSTLSGVAACLTIFASAASSTAVTGFLEEPSAARSGLESDDLRLDQGAAILLLDGSPLDVLEGAGHAGPLLMDLDGEGPLDLLVGDLRGTLHMYLGRATEEGLRYESTGPLQTDGEDIRVHNW